MCTHVTVIFDLHSVLEVYNNKARLLLCMLLSDLPNDADAIRLQVTDLFNRGNVISQDTIDHIIIPIYNNVIKQGYSNPEQ